MGIFQNFCKHQWKLHDRNVEKITHKRIVEGTEMFEDPILEDIDGTFITEVLICDKCGKIEIIEY